MFDTTREARIRQFWPTDQPLAVLAAEWNCSKAYVSQQAKRLGLPSRVPRVREIRAVAFQEKFSGRIENYKYLESEAKKRGLTVDRLRNKIIAIVIADHLVGAICDDADELRAVA